MTQTVTKVKADETRVRVSGITEEFIPAIIALALEGYEYIPGTGMMSMVVKSCQMDLPKAVDDTPEVPSVETEGWTNPDAEPTSGVVYSEEDAIAQAEGATQEELIIAEIEEEENNAENEIEDAMAEQEVNQKLGISEEKASEEKAEEPKKKRKRRTKAEIKADKAKEEGNAD